MSVPSLGETEHLAALPALKLAQLEVSSLVMPQIVLFEVPPPERLAARRAAVTPC